MPQSKPDLRTQLKSARARLAPELVSGWSLAIASRLAATTVWRQAATIHCYIGALDGEARTRALIERAWQERKRVICPCVRPHGQLAHHLLSDWAQLQSAAFGLSEPDPELAPPADPASAELILVPGVAFLADGSRLGMGGGYYDRFLSEMAAPKVGLAFEMQLAEQWPRAPHDQPVDLIATELRIIQCR